jgi:ubiquinone/menaquinone biosynthesis C-methylase UbiE/superfamily II DNA or RNA helicase
MKLMAKPREPGWPKNEITQTTEVPDKVEQNQYSITDSNYWKNLEREKESGLFVDKHTGRKWGTSKTIASLLDIHPSTFLKHSERVSKISALENRTLFDLEEARITLADYLSKKMVDEETRIYTTEEGKRYGSLNYFSEKYKLIPALFYKLAEPIAKINGRSHGGGAADLWDIDEFESKHKEYLERKLVDLKTRIYTDEEGRQYSYQKYFTNLWKITIGAFKRETTGLLTIPGRNHHGACELYEISQVEQAVKEYAALPKINDEERIFRDKTGKSWAHARYFRDTYGIKREEFNKKVILADVPTLMVRGRALEGRTTLYDFDKCLELLTERIKQKPTTDEGGLYIDQDRIQWGSQRYFSIRYGISRSALLRRLSDIDKINSALDSTGHTADLYRIDQVVGKLEEKYIDAFTPDREVSVLNDDEGRKMVAIGYIKNKYGIDEETLLTQFPGISKEVSLTAIGTKIDLYPLDQVEEKIGEMVLTTKVDQEGVHERKDGTRWAEFGFFLKNFPTITRAILKKFSEQVPAIPAYNDTNDSIVRLFREDRLRFLIESYQARYTVDKDTGVYVHTDGSQWTNTKNIAFKFNITLLLAYSIINGLQTMPGVTHGLEVNLYNLADIEKRIAERMASPRANRDGIYRDEAGVNFGTPAYFIRLFPQIGYNTFKRKTQSVRKIEEGAYDLRERSVILYEITSTKACLKEYLAKPSVDQSAGVFTDENKKQWAPAIYFVKNSEPKISYTFLSRRLEGISYIDGLDSNRFEVKLYDVGAVKKKIDEDPMIRDLQQGEKRKKFENFINDAVDGKTVDGKTFKALIGVFGASRCADLLYIFHPEFKGLPVEYVKGALAEYLGDFLVAKHDFIPPNIEIAVSYLSESTFREGLYETLKDHCLRFYFEERRKNPTKTSQEIIYGYLDYIVGELHHLNNQLLDDVIQDVVLYYNSVLRDFHKPEQFIERLDPKREFPDINQRINMKELADKKRLLIADEMGLGKSASVIMAKEQLGVKCALVVAPSNVLDTWQRYLSEKGGNGEGGYYQPGTAPHVLRVTSPEQLVDISEESYDFILVSQERMSEEYVNLLEPIDYGMMIVDEVHKMKSLGGMRTQEMMRLANNIQGDKQYLALLSGTPVPNKVEDVAITLKLLYPEKFSDIADQELVQQIIQGDIVDLRSLLLPRMQMKSLEEGVEMPQLTEETREISLSSLEKDVYEVLLEDDELTATEKMKILRQYLLNPELIDATPGIPSAKIGTLGGIVADKFRTKDKVVVFFNDYVEGIIRGEKQIIDKLHIPSTVTVRIIHGETPANERAAIQQEFNSSNQKILLLVGGQTADVGVDFSGAEQTIFYNEPWTEYQRRQELARAYRPGLKHPLESETLVVQGTIEQGIHEYIERKYRAIEKLLQGIPITEMEQELLRKDEKSVEPDLSVNPELAEYYFSTWDKMMRIFGYVREIGEVNFRNFLEKFGKDYAEGYIDLGNRSYQSNANRISGTIIRTLVESANMKPTDVRILDIASGPEMLKQHILEDYQGEIYSMDINREHFSEVRDKETRIVGSFLNLPYADKAFDFLNLCLSLHYTTFVPSKGNLERLQIFVEMNRVLKMGGKVVINLMHTREFKNKEKFQEAANALGFSIVDAFTDDVTVQDRYRSGLVTLEKVADIETKAPIETISSQLGKEKLEGLKFTKMDSKIKDSRRMITSFELHGQIVPIKLNETDQEILQEEQMVLQQGEELKATYGSVESIPPASIIQNSFIRIKSGEKYILFKKLTKGAGVVVVK